MSWLEWVAFVTNVVCVYLIVREKDITPDAFYTIWADALRDVCGGRQPDVLFTSEDYGEIAARYLGCRHIMVDRDRSTVPISATQIRSNPFANWEFLDPVVQPYFTKTVCVIGPESTGKTTLCENLAGHFQTVWQPEWARDYLGSRHCEYADMEVIARGHFAEHPLYKVRANKILLMDTDAITTLVYSQHYYGRVPTFVREMADRMREYVDLYLLTDIDVPWVADVGRDLGEPRQRAAIKQALLDNLDGRSLPYFQIFGDWDERIQSAVRAIEDRLLLARRPDER